MASEFAFHEQVLQALQDIAEGVYATEGHEPAVTVVSAVEQLTAAVQEVAKELREANVSLVVAVNRFVAVAHELRDAVAEQRSGNEFVIRPVHPHPWGTMPYPHDPTYTAGAEPPPSATLDDCAAVDDAEDPTGEEK
jgi:hypothetical protein